jgi:hypothetical protein
MGFVNWSKRSLKIGINFLSNIIKKVFSKINLFFLDFFDGWSKSTYFSFF